MSGDFLFFIMSSPNSPTLQGQQPSKADIDMSHEALDLPAVQPQQNAPQDDWSTARGRKRHADKPKTVRVAEVSDDVFDELLARSDAIFAEELAKKKPRLEVEDPLPMVQIQGSDDKMDISGSPPGPVTETDHLVHFPHLARKPFKVPCSLIVDSFNGVGSVNSRSDGWMVYLQLDGGYKGVPVLRLWFVANLRKRANERVHLAQTKTNAFQLEWSPGTSRLMPVGAQEESTHSYGMANFNFLENRNTLRLNFVSQGSISVKGRPEMPVWDQYGSVAVVLKHLFESTTSKLCISIAATHYGYRANATAFALAFESRFKSFYNYPRQYNPRQKKLWLTRVDTIKAIVEALKSHLPHLEVGNPLESIEAYFALRKHLGALLDLGFAVTPSGAIIDVGITPGKLQNPIIMAEGSNEELEGESDGRHVADERQRQEEDASAEVSQKITCATGKVMENAQEGSEDG